VGLSESGKYTFKTVFYNTTIVVPFNISFEGLAGSDVATLTVLTAPSPTTGNTLVNSSVTADFVSKSIN
jgi:hypothetical protein